MTLGKLPDRLSYPNQQTNSQHYNSLQPSPLIFPMKKPGWLPGLRTALING